MKYFWEIRITRVIKEPETDKRFGDATKIRDQKGTKNCRGAAKGRNR
jgi:hypothetical protein